MMKVPPIPFNFYGGFINRFEYESESAFWFEAQLMQQLDGGRTISFEKAGPIVTIRFGGLENFDEVKTFFAGFTPTAAEFHGVNYSSEHVSRPAKLFVAIGFDRIGSVIVRCKTVTIDDTYHSWHLIYD